jgi:hypothetical protein
MTSRRSEPRPIVRVAFQSRGRVYEIYARSVTEGRLFGERSPVVVDPGEESLKAEFAGVRRTFIARVTAADTGAATIAPFPTLLPSNDKPSRGT